MSRQHSPLLTSFDVMVRALGTWAEERSCLIDELVRLQALIVAEIVAEIESANVAALEMANTTIASQCRRRHKLHNAVLA